MSCRYSASVTFFFYFIFSTTLFVLSNFTATMPPIRRARLLKRPLDILAPPAYYKNKKHLSGYTTISGANMRNFSDRSIIRRANIKLVELIVQTRYKEASVLFSEFLKTAKFSVADTWEVQYSFLYVCTVFSMLEFIGGCRNIGSSCSSFTVRLLESCLCLFTPTTGKIKSCSLLKKLS